MLAATLSRLLFAAPDPDVVAEVSALAKAKKLTLASYHDCEAGPFRRVEVHRRGRSGAKAHQRPRRRGLGAHRDALHDSKGRVRVLQVEVGAVPSAWVKESFVFDETGKVVKKRRKFGGEGPNAYASEPDDYLIASPKQWLSRHGCPAP